MASPLNLHLYLPLASSFLVYPQIPLHGERVFAGGSPVNHRCQIRKRVRNGGIRYVKLFPNNVHNHAARGSEKRNFRWGANLAKLTRFAYKSALVFSTSMHVLVSPVVCLTLHSTATLLFHPYLINASNRISVSSLHPMQISSMRLNMIAPDDLSPLN